MLIQIHQYKIHILYNPNPDPYIADYLSRQIHTENRDEEILDIEISIQTISLGMCIPTCISIKDIREAPQNDMYM